MKPIIINMNEMSDCQEVYDSKPNRALPAFLYTCLALFVVAVVWMYFGKMDIVVNANGMLRPSDTVNTVVNIVAGEVTSLSVEDGSGVKAGELLYVIDHEELLLQKEFYEAQVALYTEHLEGLETYLQSVKDDINYFVDMESAYAIRYESFKLQIDAMRTELGTEEEKEYASVNKFKNDEVVAILQSIETYKASLREAEIQLTSIMQSIEDCHIKAPCDGVVNMLQEPVVGNWMSVGTEVCSILPADENGYKCVIYIENADVGGLEPGMPIKLNVYSYPNAEYGYVYGTLTKISNDIRVDSQSGMAYYLAEASVDAGSFLDASGMPILLKAGMACEAKIITGEEKIMSFVLEKLNLLAE